MEILYKKEKEEADQLLEQQRLVSSNKLFIQTFCQDTLRFVSHSRHVCSNLFNHDAFCKLLTIQ